jgi:hypothetical protein
MDTSCPEIEFDAEGICGFCRGVKGHIGRKWFPDPASASTADERFEEIRRKGINRQFDSILGISGGVDSAVVARRAIQNGLRPLAVHIDGGWNTRESVLNVKSLSEKLNIELRTIVIDWSEMREIQLAFLRSGTLNQDIPQDHSFFVSLYKLAIELNIPTILSGVNFATESVEPTSWGHSYIDGTNLKSIVRKSGYRKRIKKYPIWTYRQYQKQTKNLSFQVFEPLNFGSYDPRLEISSLKEIFDWASYDGKHGESIFTSWFQKVYLPERYGIDKRKSHLSSLIISGLMSREEAIHKLVDRVVEDNHKNELSRIVAQKLQISTDTLSSYLQLPHRENGKFKVGIS